MRKSSKPKDKKEACDKFQLLADKLLSLMESGTLPWRKPWHGIPYCNAISGHRYQGLNPLLAQVDVLANGYSTPLFAGFAQATEQGWKVRKGSKATWLRWSGTICKEEEDATGEVTETFIRSLKWLQVFNLDCFDDTEAETKIADVVTRFKGQENTAPRIDEAERLISAQKATVQFGGHEACYVPRQDFIKMPQYADFSSPELYYAVHIHELIHWTAHESRLDRPIQNRFGSNAYAFEELVAELGAAFVCSELGITPALEHHASYLESWISVIRADNRAFFKATAMAQKAANLLLENAGVVSDVDDSEVDKI
jgi:antirestriction protein ArdC